MVNTSLRKLPPFRHQKLGLSKPCIRLLEVVPRAKDTVSISCKIRHVFLPEADFTQKFIALSYVWGDTNGHFRVISVNGRDYSVLESLYTFLETHGRHGISNLWVDSICIDQSNKLEREITKSSS